MSYTLRNAIIGRGRVGEGYCRFGAALVIAGGLLLICSVLTTLSVGPGVDLQACGVIIFVAGVLRRHNDLRDRGILHDRDLWD